MDHDSDKENWSRGANRYCACPAWRYNPRHPKPTNPDCEMHGEPKPQPPLSGIFYAQIGDQA